MTCKPSKPNYRSKDHLRKSCKIQIIDASQLPPLWGGSGWGVPKKSKVFLLQKAKGFPIRVHPTHPRLSRSYGVIRVLFPIIICAPFLIRHQSLYPCPSVPPVSSAFHFPRTTHKKSHPLSEMAPIIQPRLLSEIGYLRNPMLVPLQSLHNRLHAIIQSPPNLGKLQLPSLTQIL